MESLIALLGLVVDTFAGLLSANSHRTEKDKQKVGIQLADTVICIDRVLARANIILSYIDRFSSVFDNETELKRLLNTLRIQVDEVETLSNIVFSLWLSSEDDIMENSKPRKYSAPTRVMAIFGDKVYDLPKILSGKRQRLRAIEHLASQSFELSAERKLIANQYIVEDEDDSEYKIVPNWHLLDKVVAKKEINLNDAKQRRIYLQMTRKELSQIEKQRDLIKKLIRDNFDVKEII